MKGYQSQGTWLCIEYLYSQYVKYIILIILYILSPKKQLRCRNVNIETQYIHCVVLELLMKLRI